ncbi:sulfur carrier protein ThiS [Paludibacter sp.]|uniref:sulfur carrier protein ThiS n=1 Tax=Paludibacter sp. TaxID=1898105 RepID=UPI001355908A|nr:sulfur carrier protein ThiS [Paludibacter sp.]MTK54055.1 sulfur carrier protein ThiS [Paludibacter sp.]
MNIYINEQIQEIASDVNVHRLVTEVLQLQIGGIAVAINESVVPRSAWKSTTLTENDKLLVIKACCGG